MRERDQLQTLPLRVLAHHDPRFVAETVETAHTATETAGGGAENAPAAWDPATRGRPTRRG